MRVVAAARRVDRLEELKEEFGDSLLQVALDVRDEGAVKNAVAQVERTWGQLDVLVNNAGLGHQQSLLEGRTELWREMLEVNVLALCVVTREALRLIRKQDEGHVFHLGSLSGHRIPAGSNVYGATKFAVRSLTESLRQELHAERLPIRVTEISPGFVQTEFHQKHFQDEAVAQSLYERIPPLQPEDVAEALAYALECPSHVAVHDVLLRNRAQGS